MTHDFQLPYVRVYMNTGDPIEERNLVEFRLIYEGEILPSGNKSRPKEKHEIRRSFHPQLRQLWRAKPTLRELVDAYYTKFVLAPSAKRAAPLAFVGKEGQETRFQLGIQAMGKNWARAGYDIVPLVIPEFALQCSLEILLLRPEQVEVFGEWADLDGQVRTILDALRMPDSAEEAAHATPEEDERPLFCLLQNDKLISEVKITADRLLMLPYKHIGEHEKALGQLNLLHYDSDGKWNFNGEQRAALDVARRALANHGKVRPNDAFVVVHVRLNYKEPQTFDNYFG